MPRLVRALATTIAAASFALALSTSPAGATPPPSDLGYSQARILELINAERAAHGLAPVRNNAGAHEIGQWSAQVQAWYGRLGHNPNLATDVTRAVTPDWHAIGENVGMGVNADHLNQMWMASPGHARNVLNPAFDTVGIGVAYGRDALWATVVFIDA